MSDSVQPHRRKPTRLPRPWDSPGKNTGVGCHFLLQCVKVKSEREVAQSCPTLSDPMDCSLPGSSVHGIFQARVLESGAIAFSRIYVSAPQFVPPSPSPTVSTSLSLCLYLYSCPANRLIRTIFLHFIDQLVTQSCPTLWDPWTVAHQAPLSMEVSRQKYWRGLPLYMLIYVICFSLSDLLHSV